MLKSTATTVKDKSKEVAKDLTEPEHVHLISRRIESLWGQRRTLMKNPVKNADELEQWRRESFEVPVAFSIPDVGRPRKRLSDNPGQRTENKILDPIIKQLEDLAEQQNIDPQVLLNKLVERSNTKWGKEKQTKSVVPVLDACAMIYNINLSLPQYQKIKSILADFGIALPPRNDIDDFKKTLMCEFTVEATKTSCKFHVLLKDTIVSLLNVNGVDITENDCIQVEGKIGIDGSGSHQIRHQLAEDDAEDDEEKKKESSYLGIFWCPLKINVNNVVVWTNILPNSTMFSRPLCLMREKENRESVLTNFQPYIQEVERYETSVNDQNFDGHSVKLSSHTEISMVDGKMVDLIQGDSGSFCHYCYATNKQGNDLTCIMQGFVIEKTAEDMLQKWEAVEAGDMQYTDVKRSGQCHRPLNNTALRYFAIMHQKLRSLDNCLKLLYHLVSGQTHTWSETNANMKDAIKAVNEETIDHIRKECGFLVDCPTPNGGNTNTGPIAQRFFAPENRNSVCGKINNSSDKSAYKELLSYFNRMLSITQSSDMSRVVDVEKVKALGRDLMIHYKRSFPWAMISPSVHQMAAHSWELFAMNGGKPIAVFAEQSGEAWNKYIRAYKSGPGSRARQCSIKLNTRDIFTRMLVQSHPLITSKRKITQCKRCEKYGHTIRSCPMNVASVLDRELSFIDSCYICK